MSTPVDVDAFVDQAIRLREEWRTVSALQEKVKTMEKMETALKVPRPVSALARRAGFGTLVKWEAVHNVSAPSKLRWQSLSGFENAGDMTFEVVDGQPEATQVTLQMTYTLPKLAALSCHRPLPSSEHRCARCTP